MKIRLGFVPNSSSSSFIVTVVDAWLSDKVKRILNKDKEKLLDKFGFIKTQIGFPDAFEIASKEERSHINDNWPSLYYGYSVACNQEDVIRFLVKHRIPFKASVHYGHYTYIYDGGNEVYSFPNYGMIFHKGPKESMNEAIGKMLMEERPIESFHITQFMSKTDQKKWDKEMRDKYEKERNTIK